jgi:ferredoxin
MLGYPMTEYQVRFLNPELGIDQTLSVPDDQYLLDSAEDANLQLPFGCRQGDCSACIAQLISGQVDQSEQKFLNAEEQAAGYTVTCVAYPRANCTLVTHQEKTLYDCALYKS